MPAAPLPANESERLDKLHSYRILDTPPEETFDRITRIAARVFNTPISLVSLVDQDRQWFKSRVGLDATETPRDLAFCAHAILDGRPLIVEDAAEDPRFSGNALVTDDPRIRFYAGAPLVTHDGHRLGTICVIDMTPRRFSADEAAMLEEFAHIAADELELRRLARSALEENAALMRAAASKDEFVSLVSHELRTPLTSIAGAIALLDAGAAGALPPRAKELTAVAARNADNLRQLVDDLLDFQQHALGAMAFDFEPLDVATVIREAAENMAGYAAAADIVIVCDDAGVPSSGALPPVLADPLRLQQVCINLLSNAVKFSPPGETVRISACRAGRNIVVTVADNGSGIPLAFQHRLFQMFAKANIVGKPAGSGIGLALTRAIVEAHGGTISFDTTPGSGTRFHVALPVAEALPGALRTGERAHA